MRSKGRRPRCPYAPSSASGASGQTCVSLGETTTSTCCRRSTDPKAAKVCITMLWPAISSYCFGLSVPAREPEPAQGTNAKQRATGELLSVLGGLSFSEEFTACCFFQCLDSDFIGSLSPHFEGLQADLETFKDFLAASCVNTTSPLKIRTKFYSHPPPSRRGVFAIGVSCNYPR